MSSLEEPRYVRFGPPPRTGRSRNRKTWKGEAGVSAYRGRMASPKCFRIDASDLLHEGFGNLIAFAASDRAAYFLEGEEVGVGSDGELLLQVEHFWAVPQSVDLTSYDGLAQPALRLWSRGPRDDSGRTRVQQRLTAVDSEYFPGGMHFAFPPPGMDWAMSAAKRSSRRPDPERKKRQKQARKKQRRKN
ncbi:MAG: hypothetical protein M3R38_25875 [Actinomycetota bacterium]|nr:hypothetical protein [Actinomycetota bacterium]MDP9487103.1 hypothetical protein [Actinomycetota bacterium]